MEDWYFRINSKAKKGQFSFSMMIHLLHEEAKTVNIQVYLVLENRLSHVECKRYHRAQAVIIKLWNDYTTGNKTANQLMKACSKHVHAPNDN